MLDKLPVDIRTNRRTGFSGVDLDRYCGGKCSDGQQGEANGDA